MIAPRRIDVDVAPMPYGVTIGSGLLASLGERLRADLDPGPCALVTDEGVAATPHADAATDGLRAAGFEPVRVVVPTGEAAKTPRVAGFVWSALAAAGLGRDRCVVAVGGGAVGDLAGFAAATWMRGVDLVHVPTTVLAMADSSVGGKTGVNLSAGKNLVGAFHQPRAVLADVDTLTTLPRRDVASGLAEVVKCAVLADRAALATLSQNAVALLKGAPGPLVDAVSLGVRVKAEIVAADPFERSGRRALLNLGHTTGHALETVTGHGVLRHGEAVAIGLVVAARLAAARGSGPADLVTTLEDLLIALELPIAVPDGVDPEHVVAATALDKKRAAGERRMVLPTLDGAEVVPVTDDALRAALA